MQDWGKQYGGLYVWWQGRVPNVVVSDPDLVKEVGVKNFAAYHDRPSPNILGGALEEHQFVASGLLFATGKQRSGVRSACEPLFHSKSLAGYTSSMQSTLDLTVDRINSVCVEKGQSIEILNALAGMAMDVIGTTAFGVEFGAQKQDMAAADGRAEKAPRILTAAKAVFQTGQAKSLLLTAFISFVPKSLYPLLSVLGVGGKKATEGMNRFLRERAYLWGASQALLQNCRGGPETLQVENIPEDRQEVFREAGNDYSGVNPAPGSLQTRLKDAVNRDTKAPLSDMEICAQSFTFLLAGYETTSTALTYTMYELAQNSAIQDRMFAEIRAVLDAKNKRDTTALEYEDLEGLTYCEAVFNEAMRKYSPVTTMIQSRIASKDCKVGTFFVPKGCKMLIDSWSIHRNEKYYPNPEQFRPERFLADDPEAQTRHPYAFIPFGVGARKCVGYRLAMMEAILALARLIEKFEFSLDTRMHNGALDMSSRITMVPVGGIWIKAVPRKH
jgi:cytochrome P450